MYGRSLIFVFLQPAITDTKSRKWIWTLSARNQHRAILSEIIFVHAIRQYYWFEMRHDQNVHLDAVYTSMYYIYKPLWESVTIRLGTIYATGAVFRRNIRDRWRHTRYDFLCVAAHAGWSSDLV